MLSADGVAEVQWTGATMMEGSVPQFVQDLKVRAGGRLFGDEHDMRTLQLLRSVGTSSGALIVDYRVLDDA